MKSLAGKVAFVTGSSRGIGRATGLRLAECGAKVIFHGMKESEKLASAVAAAGNGAEAFTADFTKVEEVTALAETLKQRDLVPEILVLNASAQSYLGVENFDSSEFIRMFHANVESSCVLLRELLPEMRKKQFGRVVFVGSINGIKPASRLAVYGATKAALMNLAKTVAIENAPYGITVNTILPGVIETDRNAEVLKDAEFAAGLKEKIPMHRFGSAEECAELILFLSTEAAGYITGNDISISGGWQI